MQKKVLSVEVYPGDEGNKHPGDCRQGSSYVLKSVHKFPWRRFYAKFNPNFDRAAINQQRISDQYHYPTSHNRLAHKRTLQMIPTLRFSGIGISNHFLLGSCSCAKIKKSSYAF